VCDEEVECKDEAKTFPLTYSLLFYVKKAAEEQPVVEDVAEAEDVEAVGKCIDPRSSIASPNGFCAACVNKQRSKF
jgi:hypothetical protein